MYVRRTLAAATLIAAIQFAPVSAQQQGQPGIPSPPPATAQPQAQPPQPEPGTQPSTAGQAPAYAPCTPADVSTALPLLDRVQRILDEAIKNELGKVSLDRGQIDEMRAEIAQIRAAIQPIRR